MAMMKQWAFETDTDRNHDAKVELNYQPQPRDPDHLPNVSLCVTNETGAKSVWIHSDTMDQLANAWIAMREAESKANGTYVPF